MKNAADHSEIPQCTNSKYYLEDSMMNKFPDDLKKKIQAIRNQNLNSLTLPL